MGHLALMERPATMTQIRGNKDGAVETHIRDVVMFEVTTSRDKKTSQNRLDRRNNSQVEVRISTDTYTPLQLTRQDCSSQNH
jgi:hypothetical protein